MALTSNSDIQSLLVAVAQLQNRVGQLERIVFPDFVLKLPDDTWENVRSKRDFLLKDSDWTMTPGSSVDQAAWASYRQVLRDLPQTFKDAGPNAVKWPKLPSTSGPNTI